ncbi:MAG: ribosomal protein [Planctomycetaceae bacterium]|jgi:small subunit ribosomal protein S20|nr:ribosomal protein [Planctomycetaceae bacterium]
MPNTSSARKNMRKDAKRRLRNRSNVSALRTLVKKFRATVASGDVATAETQYKLVSRRFDQAAAKNILHKNAASRMKSRLMILINKAKAPKDATPAPAAPTAS